MKSLTILFFLIICLASNAQIKFEKGYIIKNNNEKEEVLIRNVDWINNPKYIDYKFSENDKIQRGDISQIKEFEINNNVKYIRANVQIDRSYEDYNSISDSEQPEFKQELLFLKVLIEDKASLYRYNDINLVRFFYKDTISNIEQLVYKKYKVKTNQYAYNNSFRGQIAKSFKCKNISIDELKNLQYRQNQLIKLFDKINECLGSTMNYNKENKSKIDFNLSIRPRLNSSKLKLSTSERSVDFGNKTGFGIGLEVEIILPFNQRKWSAIIEPIYQSYKVDDVKIKPNLSANFADDASVNYKTLELPIGIRHYMFLNNKSKLFASIQYMLNFNLDSSLKFKRGEYEYANLDISNRGNLALGFGYNYNDKLSVEFRLLTNRKVTDYIYWDSKFNSLSFIIGYTIF